MTIVLEVALMRDILDEIKPLHRRNWDEMQRFAPRGECNPDYDRYIALQGAGSAILTTARRDGTLIGYCSFFLNSEMMTRERYAIGEVIYVVPEERGTVGVRLFKYAHQVLAHLGYVDVRHYCTPDNHIGALLLRMGYVKSGDEQYKRYRP